MLAVDINFPTTWAALEVCKRNLAQSRDVWAAQAATGHVEAWLGAVRLCNCMFKYVIIYHVRLDLTVTTQVT